MEKNLWFPLLFFPDIGQISDTASVKYVNKQIMLLLCYYTLPQVDHCLRYKHQFSFSLFITNVITKYCSFELMLVSYFFVISPTLYDMRSD